MTLSETDKLCLELNANAELYPASFKGFEVSQDSVQGELAALQQSNERLQEQVAALQSRNDELEAYTRGVTHNLKNPLSVIIMATDAIHKIGDLTPKELGEYLRQIRFTAYEMDNIIEKFLLFSELRNAEVPVSPVNMADVVEHICMRMRSLLRDRHAQVRLPEHWPVALGYGPWLEEVWANYLSNALQYGGKPPLVEFGAAAQEDGMLRFWIRDNGVGLSKETQAHLFMPFSQFSKVYRHGHGLGLSIVRSIVEKLGGKVGVESELHHGSLFFFTLPAYSAETMPVLDGELE